MKLVIAEKKSVATAIAQALCAAPVQRDGCYECGQLLVTWAQGHLIDLAMPFWMELPDYRLPPLGELLRGTGQRLGAFLRKAGSLLLLASVAVWFAASFGWEQGGFGELSSGALSGSLLAGVGRYLAPLFAPLGWGDWRLVVAACSGLLAKESIVSTLGVLCPGGLAGLSLTVPAALSFLLFNLLCAPCLAALAALRQEMASPRHFWFAVAYQTALAWLTAFGVYQVGTLLLRL